MPRHKSIKVKNKRFTIHEVPVPADAVEHLVEKGYKRPYKDTIGLANIPDQQIIIAEKLPAKEKESTIFHELIHIAVPGLSEKVVLQLESALFPILHSHGLRFRKKKN